MKKKKKSKLVHILLLLFSIGIVGFIILIGINGYVTLSMKNRIITTAQAENLTTVDCILILGAGLNKENKPSPILEDRLNLGIKLYKKGVSNKIIVSGDHGTKAYDEVNVMKQYAIDAGVPSEDIFMDHAGFSTYESFYRARDIFKADKIVVITQRFHMYRALFDGKGLGLDVYGVTSDTRKYGGHLKWESREILARSKDFLYIIAKPKPTYLGEAIPVSGDGDATNDK